MYKSKSILILFALTAIAGTLGYAANIVWLVSTFWFGFIGLIIAGLIVLTGGIINSVKEQSYGIAAAGIIGLTAVIIWATWMLLDSYSKGWNW